jgi:hypothetical protein
MNTNTSNHPAHATWVYDDGGRGAAGFSTRTAAGDCVVRAIAIAGERDYREVYDALAKRSAELGGRRSARDGVSPRVYRPMLEHDWGWSWTPTMAIGSGCTVHLRADELPVGRLVVSLSRHLAAVIDGTVHDTYDPTRGGTRCVYGYWTVR